MSTEMHETMLEAVFRGVLKNNYCEVIWKVLG